MVYRDEVQQKRTCPSHCCKVSTQPFHGALKSASVPNLPRLMDFWAFHPRSVQSITPIVECIGNIFDIPFHLQ
ncbi:hypothetical protein TNCV_2707511 [Trichonephila clavipes]|nr:hypothetical protein TNCV_2707511 [Trichonephila clavipes]